MVWKESAPYLLTILIAALGWSLTHFADRVVQSPVLEYSADGYDVKKSIISYKIKNISSSSLFADLYLYVHLPPNSPAKCIGTPDLDIPAPTHLGKERKAPVCVDGKYAEFFVPQLHPGAEILLSLRVSSATEASLRVMSKNPVRLLESGWKTFFIENEISILSGMIMFWLLAIMVFYLIAGKEKVNK